MHSQTIFVSILLLVAGTRYTANPRYVLQTGVFALEEAASVPERTERDCVVADHHFVALITIEWDYCQPCSFLWNRQAAAIWLVNHLIPYRSHRAAVFLDGLPRCKGQETRSAACRPSADLESWLKWHFCREDTEGYPAFQNISVQQTTTLQLISLEKFFFIPYLTICILLETHISETPISSAWFKFFLKTHCWSIFSPL